MSLLGVETDPCLKACLPFQAAILQPENMQMPGPTQEQCREEGNPNSSLDKEIVPTPEVCQGGLEEDF